jgi:hypothetical protein
MRRVDRKSEREAELFRRMMDFLSSSMVPFPVNMEGLCDYCGIVLEGVDFGRRAELEYTMDVLSQRKDPTALADRKPSSSFGLAFWEKNRPRIFFNKNLNEPWKRYIIAHELGHLLGERDIEKAGIKSSRYALFYDRISPFAYEMLIPACALIEASIMNDFRYLPLIFGVLPSAILDRIAGVNTKRGYYVMLLHGHPVTVTYFGGFQRPMNEVMVDANCTKWPWRAAWKFPKVFDRMVRFLAPYDVEAIGDYPVRGNWLGKHNRALPTGWPFIASEVGIMKNLKNAFIGLGIGDGGIDPGEIRFYKTDITIRLSDGSKQIMDVWVFGLGFKDIMPFCSGYLEYTVIFVIEDTRHQSMIFARNLSNVVG